MEFHRLFVGSLGQHFEKPGIDERHDFGGHAVVFREIDHRLSPCGTPDTRTVLSIGYVRIRPRQVHPAIP